MKTMPQLVGDSHDVAEIVCIVAQDVGVELRRRGSAESAAAFALADLCIDPTLGEKLVRDSAKGRGKSAKSIENDFPRAREGKFRESLPDGRVLIEQGNL